MQYIIHPTASCMSFILLFSQAAKFGSPDPATTAQNRGYLSRVHWSLSCCLMWKKIPKREMRCQLSSPAWLSTCSRDSKSTRKLHCLSTTPMMTPDVTRAPLEPGGRGLRWRQQRHCIGFSLHFCLLWILTAGKFVNNVFMNKLFQFLSII